ncbi:MAG: membrane protein insertase YidC [Hasllibacter sp.]
MEENNNRNLILATVLSTLVLLIWFVMFPPAEQTPATGPDSPVTEAALGEDGTAPTPGIVATGEAPAGPAPAAAAAEAPRVPIQTPELTGSINLAGGRIDDLSLTQYRETLDPESPLVRLLAPVNAPGSYYALFGWAPTAALGYDAVPGAATPWTVAEGAALTPATPVTLEWDNGAGLTFRRTIAVDEDFMFTVTQEVANATGAAVRLAPYGLVARHGEPDTVGFFILHEGVVRMSDGELQEIDYDDMPDLDPVAREGGAAEIVEVAGDGWVGFTDKYWMATIIPEAGPFASVAKYVPSAEIYQTEARLPLLEVAPGASASTTMRLFAGAKEWETIREYEAGREFDGFLDSLAYGLFGTEAGIAGFLDSIDWGWFFFLTKPIFFVLHELNALIGNMGVAIIVLTLIIKAILLPLAYKSYVSMAKMKELQPEMEKVKERAGDDRQKLQQEMMKMYREKKVNPAAGCLPLIAQIPIFFALYKVIFVTLELRHAPFFGPFQDLAAPDPTSIFNLFGALPWAAPEPGTILALIFIGILPLLLGISMWLQQKLNPAPTDPTQAMIFAYLPWVFMFMLGGFASGLVVYWIANNTITFIQQYTIMRSQGMKPDVFGNIRQGFRRKSAEK